MSNRLFASLAFLAVVGLLCLPGLVRADGDEPKVEVGGKVIVIGPDGKRHEFDLGKAVEGKVSGGKSIRVEIRGKEGKVEIGGEEANKKKPKADGVPKVQLDRVVGGKIVIVGPDGKRREIDLGKAGEDKAGEDKAGKGKAIRLQIMGKDGKIEIPGGKDLPPEVRKRLEELKKRIAEGKLPEGKGGVIIRGYMRGPDGKIRTLEMKDGVMRPGKVLEGEAVEQLKRLKVGGACPKGPAAAKAKKPAAKLSKEAQIKRIEAKIRTLQKQLEMLRKDSEK